MSFVFYCIAQLALNFVNESWESLYEAMMPETTNDFNDEIKELLNNMFSKLSFSKTFP